VFVASTRRSAFRSGPVPPNLDADHANGAVVSESAAGLPSCHGAEPTTRKWLSVEHGAVKLVTKHPLDSRHPRHGVQDVLPTQGVDSFLLLESLPKPPTRSGEEPKKRTDRRGRRIAKDCRSRGSSAFLCGPLRLRCSEKKEFTAEGAKDRKGLPIRGFPRRSFASFAVKVF